MLGWDTCTVIPQQQQSADVQVRVCLMLLLLVTYVVHEGSLSRVQSLPKACNNRGHYLLRLVPVAAAQLYYSQGCINACRPRQLRSSHLKLHGQRHQPQQGWHYPAGPHALTRAAVKAG